MRVVLDTHVLLSGTSNAQGYCGNIVQAWNNHQFEIALSPRMVLEIQRVLTYPYITETLHWSDSFKVHFLSNLNHKAVLIPDPPLALYPKMPTTICFLLVRKQPTHSTL